MMPHSEPGLPLITMSVGASAAIISRLVSIPVILFAAGGAGVFKVEVSDVAPPGPAGCEGDGAVCPAAGTEIAQNIALKSKAVYLRGSIRGLPGVARDVSAQCAWRSGKLQFIESASRTQLATLDSLEAPPS